MGYKILLIIWVKRQKRFETLLKSKLKIPVQKFIEDLNDGLLSDQKVMEKYGLDPRQMVFVLGKLAETRRISFKRVVFVVRNYLDLGELEKAEICLKVVKKYFAGIWGVQTMFKGLEHDLVSLKSRTAFQQKMDEKSKSLERFRLEHPATPLHPAVVSSVKVLDYCTDKIHEKEKKDPVILKLPEAWSRLKIYTEHAHYFAKFDSNEATRFWHYISLKLFYQENIRHFMIRGMMDADTRDICMHLDGTRFSVSDVFLEADGQNEAGKSLPVKCFPSLMDIEDLSPEQKSKVLMENGWYLPPFCENCRCQIFPCK
jgi:hypothetical protein